MYFAAWQEVCLHAVVAGRTDRAVLLAAIRKLPPSHVLALLTYLRKWVERHAGVGSLSCEAPLLGVHTASCRCLCVMH